MRLSEILRQKAFRIVGLPPSATAQEAANLMRTERVGAVLVRDYQGRLLGVLSERDLALAIADQGAELASARIGQLMATASPMASPADPVWQVMQIMTEQRVRHMPVVEGDTIVGVVSIGDILKARLAEKVQENAVLQDIARARLPA